MEYKMNMETKNALEGLAFWSQELSWAQEKKLPKCEMEKITNTMDDICNECDKLHIPYWAQNAAISMGWDWRTYQNTSFVSYMSTKGITYHA